MAAAYAAHPQRFVRGSVKAKDGVTRLSPLADTPLPHVRRSLRRSASTLSEPGPRLRTARESVASR
jgi:hypothetical protein